MRVARSLAVVLLVSTALAHPGVGQEADGPYFRLGMGATQVSEGPPDMGGNNGPLQITLTPEIPASVTVGDSFDGDLAIFGGTPSYDLTLSGQLPIGVVRQNGADNVHPVLGIFGLPGDYTFTWTATDQASGSAVYGPRTIDVDAPLEYADDGVVFRRNVVGSATPQISGGETEASYSFVPLSGAAPAGMSYGTNGVISGTPTTAGSGQLTGRATDADSRQDTAVISWEVEDALELAAPPVSGNAQSGQAYSGPGLTANNAIGTVTWSLHSGTLPPGLGVNSGTGAIFGTPTAPGTYSGIVLAGTDSGDGSVVLTPPFSITVGGYYPGSYSGSLAYFTGYPVNITASFPAATGAVTWTHGGLPSGIVLDSSTGVLSGSRSTAGTSSITLTGTDTLGHQTQVQFTLQVTAAAYPTIIQMGYQASTGSITVNTSAWSLTSGDVIMAVLHQSGSAGSISAPSNMRGIISYGGGLGTQDAVEVMFHQYLGGTKPSFTFPAPSGSNHQGVATYIIKGLRVGTQSVYNPVINGITQNHWWTAQTGSPINYGGFTTDDHALYVGIIAHGTDIDGANFTWSDPTDALLNESELLDQGTTLGNGGGISIFTGLVRGPGTYSGPRVTHGLNGEMRVIGLTFHPPVATP